MTQLEEPRSFFNVLVEKMGVFGRHPGYGFNLSINYTLIKQGKQARFHLGERKFMAFFLDNIPVKYWSLGAPKVSTIQENAY